MSLQALPKVELHLHLDCSLSYEVVQRLAPHISHDEYRRDFIAPRKCTNLADFLTRSPSGFKLMQSREALHLVTRDVFDQLRRDHVIYVEIRFAPLLHLERGLSPEAVVAAVEEATRAASTETGIEARIILCTLRHFTGEDSIRTARLVEEFRGTLVVALDIAGDEAGYTIDAHIPAFEYAMERGLPRTAHAGEAAGPKSVWETLDAFRPSRIGHGVRSAEDYLLLERLIQDRIHLEVCPTSNIQTNICATLADHPVDRLYRRGISLGISTDTRTITDVTLRDEYARLAETFGWKAGDFLQCNLNAVNAAFVLEEVRVRLRERLIDAYAGG